MIHIYSVIHIFHLFTYTINKALLEGILILNKIKKHPLFFGTMLLTGAGILSRILGFFYRIFLSRTFGASGLGLYQLIFPVFTLCIAICASGIQTAISRFVASEQDKKRYLFSGLILSILLSSLLSVFVYILAQCIAETLLKAKLYILYFLLYYQ